MKFRGCATIPASIEPWTACHWTRYRFLSTLFISLIVIAHGPWRPMHKISPLWSVLSFRYARAWCDLAVDATININIGGVGKLHNDSLCTHTLLLRASEKKPAKHSEFADEKKMAENNRRITKAEASDGRGLRFSGALRFSVSVRFFVVENDIIRCP